MPDKNDIDKYDTMTIDELQLVIEGYVAVLNTHVLMTDELRGKLRKLRDIQHKKMLIV